jgi:hypothetical protein
MDNAARSLAQAEQCGEPGVGILERKAGQHQHEEAGEQNTVLPALVERHTQHCVLERAAAGGQLGAPDDEVMEEHSADDQQDERNVDAAHPAHRH